MKISSLPGLNVFLIAVLFLSVRSLSAKAQEDSNIESIRNSVRSILKNDLQVLTAQERKFTYEQIDLNGDGKKETFVGFNAPYFCGSGGCTAMLLSSTGKLITTFTVTEYPIMVLNSKSKGWHDLVIGTASVKPSLHLVKWNGKKYPGNPSMQPEYTAIPDVKLKRIFNFNAIEEKWFDF